MFEDVVTCICNGELLYAKFHTHRYQFSIGAEKTHINLLLNIEFEKVVTVHKGG